MRAIIHTTKCSHDQVLLIQYVAGMVEKAMPATKVNNVTLRHSSDPIRFVGAGD